MRILICCLFICSALACKKGAPDNINEMPAAGTVVVSGEFTGTPRHPSTAGTVKIVRDASGKLSLSIENFRSDNGPDLRVWLSPGTTGSPYQEVGLLKAITGNFSYELDAAKDFRTNNHVLIWCEDFSVLFGHAVLR